MRSHGWSGNTPASDEEAIDRILDAAEAIVSERGSAMKLADVARTLGVTRQTVYRYFPGTEALQIATAMRSADGFLDRLGKRLRGSTDPVAALTEGIAFAVENLTGDPQIEVILGGTRRDSSSSAFTSDTALTFGLSMLHSTDVDWAAHGYDEAGLEELAEFGMRAMHSLLMDQGRPPRRGAELRRYLTRWIGPAIAYPRLAQAIEPLAPTVVAPTPTRKRRVTAVS